MAKSQHRIGRLRQIVVVNCLLPIPVHGVRNQDPMVSPTGSKVFTCFPSVAGVLFAERREVVEVIADEKHNAMRLCDECSTRGFVGGPIGTFVLQQQVSAVDRHSQRQGEICCGRRLELNVAVGHEEHVNAGSYREVNEFLRAGQRLGFRFFAPAIPMTRIVRGP